MGEATGPLPAMTEMARLIAVSREVLAKIDAGTEVVRRCIEARGPLTELVIWSNALLDAADTYRKGTMYAETSPALDDAPALAAVPEPEPEPGRHRHRRRVPRPRIPGEHPVMRVVPAVVLAALLAAARCLGRLGKAAGAHPAALTAHTVRLAAAVTAGTTGVAVAVTGAVVVLSAPPGTPAARPGAHFSFAAPAASIEGAVRVRHSPEASPSGGFAGPRAETAADRKDRGSLAPVPPLLLPSSSPQPSRPATSSSPPAGTLSAGSTDITVTDPSEGTEIPLSASGGDVSWHAWVTGPDASDVTLSPSSGDLGDDDAGYIAVSFGAGAEQAGSVIVHIWGGTGQALEVTVSWEAVPQVVSSPEPAVTPAGAPSKEPAASPSPS